MLVLVSVMEAERLFSKTGFLKPLLTLSSGNVLSQIIVLAAAPILSRLYEPEAFGIVVFFIAIYAVLQPFACLRYEAAIVLAPDDQDALALLKLCVVIAFSVAIILGGLIYFSPIRIFIESIGYGFISEYLIALPVAVLLIGIVEAMRNYHLRKKHFRRMTISQIAQSTGAVALQCALAIFFSFETWGLVAGAMVGMIAALLVLVPVGAEGINFFGGSSQPTLRHVGWVYRRNALYLPWGGLFDAAGLQASGLIVPILLGPAAAGIYAIADRVIKAPAVLLIGSAAKINYQRMSDPAFQVHLPKHIWNWAMAAIISSVPFVAILIFFGDTLFGFVFGAPWAPSGKIAAALVPYFIGVAIVNPFSGLLIIAERQKWLLGMQMVLFISAFSGLFAGYVISGTLFGATLGYALAQFGAYIVYFYFLIRAAHQLAQAAKRL